MNGVNNIPPWAWNHYLSFARKEKIFEQGTLQ